MSTLTRFVLLFVHFTFISATFEIPFRCFIWDMECMTNLAQIGNPDFADGLPDISIKPLDPMYIPFLRVDEPGFKADITNLTITGYKNSIVKKMSIDIAKSLVTTGFYTDLTLKGRYKPIAEDREVDMLMIIKNIDLDLKMSYEIMKNANNYDVLQLSSYAYTYEIKESQCYRKDLYSKSFNNAVFFNPIQNWRLISIPFGRSFMDKFADNIYIALRTFLSSQPLRNVVEY